MADFSEIIGAVYRRDYSTLSGLTSEEANTSDGDGRSLLMHAVLAMPPDPSIVKLLIDRGADVNVADSLHKSTALHFAASFARHDLATTLLDAGASVDPMDLFGNTPLWEAAMRPKSTAAVVRELLQRGADPQKKNYRGVSPFDIAREGEHRDLVSLFEEKE
jgi:uncharacterized protein